ncbi:MAG: flagellar biosynthetic protein FliO [Candidatus Dactylopiibacterium carminicum]|nr:MAG: flagellar biosynthetic protein FliO [Candidatus Dactylopiibacterium carminicum]
MLVLLSACLFQSAALASEGPPSAVAGIGQMLLGLGVTLALLFGALHLLRRLQGAQAAKAGALRVLSATPVGPRERVVLVAVGEEVLVLGVAPGRISPLHRLPLSALPSVPEGTPATPDFAAKLRQLMERRRDQ